MWSDTYDFMNSAKNSCIDKTDLTDFVKVELILFRENTIYLTQNDQDTLEMLIQFFKNNITYHISL